MRQQLTLDLAEGGTTVRKFASPNLLLARMLQESRPLQELYAEALGKYPTSPEHPMALAHCMGDNVPGNKLALQSSGKSMELSNSFLELGMDARHHDCVWFTPVVVRASTTAAVSGGLVSHAA